MNVWVGKYARNHVQERQSAQFQAQHKSSL